MLLQVLFFLGSEDVTTNLLIEVCQAGRGAAGLSSINKDSEEGLGTRLVKIASLSNGFEGSSEVQLLRAFSDNKGLGASPQCYSCMPAQTGKKKTEI